MGFDDQGPRSTHPARCAIGGPRRRSIHFKRERKCRRRHEIVPIPQRSCKRRISRWVKTSRTRRLTSANDADRVRSKGGTVAVLDGYTAINASFLMGAGLARKSHRRSRKAGLEPVHIPRVPISRDGPARNTDVWMDAFDENRVI